MGVERERTTRSVGKVYTGCDRTGERPIPSGIGGGVTQGVFGFQDTWVVVRLKDTVSEADSGSMRLRLSVGVNIHVSKIKVVLRKDTVLVGYFVLYLFSI